MVPRSERGGWVPVVAAVAPGAAVSAAQTAAAGPSAGGAGISGRRGWRRVRGTVSPVSVRGVLLPGGRYKTPFPGGLGPVSRVVPEVFCSGLDNHHSRWRSRQATSALTLVTRTAEPGNLPEIMTTSRRESRKFPGVVLRTPQEQGAISVHAACTISGGYGPVCAVGAGAGPSAASPARRPRRGAVLARATSPWPDSPGLAGHRRGRAPRRAGTTRDECLRTHMQASRQAR